MSEGETQVDGDLKVTGDVNIDGDIAFSGGSGGEGAVSQNDEDTNLLVPTGIHITHGVLGGWGFRGIDKYRQYLSDHVKFSEASGTAVGEFANNGAGFTYTDVGSVTRRAGKDGNAAEFDGTNRLDGPNDAAFNPGTGAFLISLWAITDGGGTVNFISKQGAGVNPGYVIRRTDPPGTINLLIFTGSGVITISGPALWTDTVFHHIMAGRNDGDAWLYLDGFVGSITANVTDVDNSELFTIGADVGGGSNMDGAVDELTWKKGITFLNDAARDQLALDYYNDGAGRFWDTATRVFISATNAQLSNINNVKFGLDTGVADAYVVDPPFIPVALVAGISAEYFAANANTGGTATLNWGGTGAIGIKDENGADPGSGAIKTTAPTRLTFDGTFWVLGVVDGSIVGSHTLGGTEHIADTLANLNTKISDATLVGITASLTEGSILFANAAGEIAQDNANLFYDDTLNQFGVGTTNPQAGLHGVVADGKLLWTDTEADGAKKTGRWGVPHFTNAEEPFFGIIHIADTSTNTIVIGGGTAAGNAATKILFRTASDNTTTLGTERGNIDSVGDFLLDNVTPAGTALEHFYVIGGGVGGADDDASTGRWQIKNVSGIIQIGSVVPTNVGLISNDIVRLRLNATTFDMSLGSSATPAVGQGVKIDSGWSVKRKGLAVSGVSADEVIISVTDTSSTRTVTIQTADITADTRIFIIKDESGAAGTNNITIDTQGSETIDGQATVTISVDFGVVRLYSNGTNLFSF